MGYIRKTTEYPCTKEKVKSNNRLRILLISAFTLLFSAAIITGALLIVHFGKHNETVNALTGAGTQEDPITISTVDELKSLATSVNAGTNYQDKYIVLENDLDLAGITWTSIGTSKRFFGNFDGQNHTISNLYINQKANGKGLFGYTTGATIENLTLYNPVIASTTGVYTGALVGYFDSATGRPGTIRNCHVVGGSIMSASYYVGGLIGGVVGRFDGGITIDNCSVKGVGADKVPTEVVGAYYVGGLVGVVEGTTPYSMGADGSDHAGVFISLCATTARVTATSTGIAGGIVGWGGGMRLDRCYSTGAISTKAGGTAAGIVGFMGRTVMPGNSAETVRQACKLTNCLATGDINVVNPNGGAGSGGIVASISAPGTTYIEDCLFTGNVLTRSSYSSGNANAGGIFGAVARSNVYVGGCAVASQQVSGLSPYTYNISAPVAGGWVYGSKCYYPFVIDGKPNYYNEDILLSARKGLHSASANRVSIGGAKSLDELKDYFTYMSLGWDFGDTWTIIPGANDGFPYLKDLGIPEQPLGSKYNPILIETAEDFKEMSNNVNTAKDLYAGQYLLQTADLDLTGVGVTGPTWAKSFRGNYDGGEHRMLNVNITSSAANTALFGYTFNSSFRNIIVENAKIYNTGSVTSVGVLIGVSPGNLYVENCAIIGGTVTAVKATNVGGLCGYCNYDGNNFVKCFSSANVSGGSRTGGLIGYAYGSNVSRCYTAGSVTGSLSAGYGCGGLIGEMTKPLGAYVYTEDVSAENNTGCVAPQSTVTNCYSKSTVTDSHAGNGWAFAGGIVGRLMGATTVSNCYYNGTISAIRNGGASSSTYGAFASGIVGTSYNTSANVTNAMHVKNCLSVMQLGQVTSTGKWLQVGYYNTYYSAKPAESEGCYYVETEFPAAKGAGAGAINGGTQTTVADIQAGSVFNTGALDWDMSEVWSHDPQVNGGFPMLRGLIVDTSELVALLNQAKKYKQSDWSTATYSVLSRAISNADRDLSGKITEKQKAQDIAALQTAIDGLRADKVELSSYYNKIIREIYPNKEYYSNFSVIESLLKGAKDILDDNSNKYRNSDVKVVYNALQVAVGNLRVDKSELNKAIEEATSLNASDYPKEAYDALLEKLMAAVEVNNNASATADEVIEATKNLREALSKLQLDKTQIANEIIKAYASIGVLAEYDKENNLVTIKDETNRITASKFENYAVFETALNNAIRVQEDEKATSRDIQDAIFDLNVTLNGLLLDKKPLEELYYKVLALNQEYYSEATFSALEQPVHDAETALQLYASPETFVEISKTIDRAYADLKAAYDGLELNKTELEQLIKRAEAEEEDYAIYTAETWQKLQDVLAEAKTVYENKDATQEQIHNAVVDLHEAIQNLDLNLEYLAELIARAEEILSDETYLNFYSPETLNALKTAKENAQALLDSQSKDIAEVKASAHELQSALDALKADTDKLKGYIRRVTDETDENYIDPKIYAAESVNALKALAAEAQEMLDDEAHTNEDVMAYTLRFEAMFGELKPNKDALVERAREISTWTNTKYRQDNEGKWILDDNGNLKVFVIYEESTWNVLQTALTAANGVILNKTASVKDVSDALAALDDAVVGLIVDTSELEERIQKAENLLNRQAQENVYTAESIAVLQAKYDAAKRLLENTAVKLTLDEVQLCLDELLAAIDGLRVDKQNLLNLIAKAEGLLTYENYFTESSVSGLSTQLNYVKENIDTENLGEDDISLLYSLLSDAIDGLEIITDDLEESVDRFDELEEEFVTDDSYELIQQYAQKAKAMLESGEFTVQEYVQALEDLATAFDTLKPDMEAFKAFIEQCKENLTLSYTEESIEALQNQIENATHVYNKEEWNEEAGKYETVEITYDKVIASVGALRDAVNALVPKKSALQQLITDTQEKMDTAVEEFGEDVKVSDCYTAESFKVLGEALENGLSVLDNHDATIEDVDKAIAQIETAIAALVVDKTRLQSLIDECDKFYPVEYFETESYNQFKTQLDKSRTDVADETISLDDYIASYSNLLAAREALVFTTDALEKIIALAETKQSADYTAASFGILSEKLAAAKDYLSAEEKDPAVYGEVCGNLLDAISGLVDIRELVKQIGIVQTFVEQGNSLENGVYYSDGSFKAVEDLLARAISLKNRTDSTQQEIDEMSELLKDYESLLLDVTLAKQFSENEHTFIDANAEKYTAETWSVYTDAVAALDTLFAKDGVTLEELNEAMNAVTAAKEALQAVPEDEKGKLFEVIENNNTFKFINGSGEGIDFKTHEFDEANPVYLTNIAAGDSLADIMAQFVNKDIRVFNAEGEEITDFTSLIATNIVLKIFEDETLVDSLTLVVRGDVNGDGVVDIFDKAALNAYTEDPTDFGEAYVLAGDVNESGGLPDIFDKAALNGYTEGTFDIFAGLSVKGAGAV